MLEIAETPSKRLKKRLVFLRAHTSVFKHFFLILFLKSSLPLAVLCMIYLFTVEF